MKWSRYEKSEEMTRVEDVYVENPYTYREPKEDEWRKANGTIIKISDMNDGHLRNAYNKFEDYRLLREMMLRASRAMTEEMK